ncbi:hypothetical protein GTR02_18750 [Kineococcus sp. R8]|nr:hypothetical protein [Kineococcus siccus]
MLTRGAAAGGSADARGVDALVRRLERACTAAGLPARSGVGRSLAVPLALRGDAGGPALAVELDGADWVAADVLDREVAVPARWERAGWHYVRASALDVLRDPAAEADRIGGVWHDDLLAERPARGGTGAPARPDAQRSDADVRAPR